MPDFVLPDLGEGLTEAEVVRWRVAAGDSVQIDQIVVDVETAKAVVEIPSPFAGIVGTLHAEPGAVVAVGSPLITIEPAETAEPAAVSEPTVETNEEERSPVLVGYGPDSGTRRHRPPRPRPVRPSTGARPARTDLETPREQASSSTVAVISPLVRKLARDAGLNLREIRGTGLDGTIVRRDVEQAMARASGSSRQGEETGERRVPLRGVRRAVAEKVSRAHREIPDVTVWVDVDATALLAARAEINARYPDDPVSLLALFTRFAILGLRRYPELNGRVDGNELVVPSAVHVGFAAQTDRGLVVPVVHDAHALTTRELNGELRRLTEAGRAGILTPAQLTGGTFTVNNYGVFGVDGSAAIINAPEVAILGLGRIMERPWVVGGQLAVRSVAELTLTFDHRICDGGTAGGYLRFVADCVESPIGALAEL